jgi:hypothetical protein
MVACGVMRSLLERRLRRLGQLATQGREVEPTNPGPAGGRALAGTSR